jgi:N-acetyl-anhydromuramyl-L-alanine amidase AmpD
VPVQLIQTPTHESNYGNGKGGNGQNLGRRFIVLHGSGKYPSATAANELAYLQTPRIRVSYHVYATKAGTLHQLVPFPARAWHAGSSRWQAGGVHYRNLNDLSIGIAFESTNALDEVYPPEQVAAVFELARNLMRAFDIPPEHVLTHKEVSDPQGRKVDPVNFEIDAFRQRLAGPPKETLPLYSETNALLGEVTIVDGRKAYLPDTVRSSL